MAQDLDPEELMNPNLVPTLPFKIDIAERTTPLVRVKRFVRFSQQGFAAAE